MLEWVHGGDAMNENIGERIRELRKRRGMTQKELAESSGLSVTSIQGYEYGKFTPKIQQLERIAAALGIESIAAFTDDWVYYDETHKEDLERVAKEADALDSVSAVYGEDAVQLLGKFSELNEQGKRKATEYITDLTEQPKYQK